MKISTSKKESTIQEFLSGIILPSVYWIVIIILLYSNQTKAQDIRVTKGEKQLNTSSHIAYGAQPAQMGIINYSDEFGIHGVTFKLSFDPSLIYPDSIWVKADGNLLELKPEEYLEMQRNDSCFVLYSLTVKGREKCLNMDIMPLLIDFKMKPKAHNLLIASNCQSQINFTVESLKTYNTQGTSLFPSPFLWPVEISCMDQANPMPLRANPNPTIERFWVWIPTEKADKISQLLLFDMSGRSIPIETTTPSNGIICIDLSSQRPGQYILSIGYSDGSFDSVKSMKL